MWRWEFWNWLIPCRRQSFFITVLNRNEASSFLAALAYVFCIQISWLLWLCSLPASEQLPFNLVDISDNVMLFRTYCLDKEGMTFLYFSERCSSLLFHWLFRLFWFTCCHFETQYPKRYSQPLGFHYSIMPFFLWNKYFWNEYLLIPTWN